MISLLRFTDEISSTFADAKEVNW